MEITPIARIRTDFREKFGVPRQSGLAEALRGTVVFEPEYRNRDALRGIDGFTHLWLLWGFSENRRSGGEWSPTVRPPRLGGNERLGVFATRSPYRPNPIGLSCVRLLAVRHDASLGPVLDVAGADMVDGTPIYDIKPYLPYTDCRGEAAGGFAAEAPEPLPVHCPDALLRSLPPEKREGLLHALALDVRLKTLDTRSG